MRKFVPEFPMSYVKLLVFVADVRNSMITLIVADYLGFITK